MCLRVWKTPIRCLFSNVAHSWACKFVKNENLCVIFKDALISRKFFFYQIPSVPPSGVNFKIGKQLMVIFCKNSFSKKLLCSYLRRYINFLWIKTALWCSEQLSWRNESVDYDRQLVSRMIICNMRSHCCLR